MWKSFEQVLKLKRQVVSVIYRFQAKDWMWLRISARIKDIVAFLNPFNENVEYIIEYCTNTHAKLFHPNNDGQTESEAIPAYGQLALDHSRQRHFARDPLYSAYHMMQNSADSKDNRKMTDLIE